MLFAASPVYTRTPLHRLVASDPRVDFTAVFASSAGIRPVDAGYARPVTWGSDVIDGYKAIFLRRADRNPIDGGFFAFRDLDIFAALRPETYDVLWLWGYNYLTHQLAALTALAGRRAIIFHENQTLLDRRPAWKSLLKKAGLPMLFGRGRGLYVGTQNRKWFEHYGMPPERLHFAPYCIDNERLQRAAISLSPARESIRQAFKIRPDSGPVILCVSRLIPKKQPEFLLEAFRRVRETWKCTLLLVGSGELQDSLHHKALTDRIPDVVMAGYLDQQSIARAYVAADIFALPSRRHETWGLAVNEAMNFGLPVVVSDKVGCAADLVQHGSNGYVVRADDVSDLAAHLGQLVQSSELRKQFGRASVQNISQWNYERAAKGAVEAIAASVSPRRWQALSGLLCEAATV